MVALECPICNEIVIDAVQCVECDQFLCIEHVAPLKRCPFFNKEPFNTRIARSIRNMVAQLPVKCRFCTRRIARGDVEVHELHCVKRPRQCGANGCQFVTWDIDEGFRHLKEAHEEIIWEEYQKTTGAGNCYNDRG